MRKTMNKYCIILLVFLICFSACGKDDSVKVLKMEKFSINIPDGWKVRKENDGGVLLIMPEAKNEEIFISILSTPQEGYLSLDERWNRIKPYMANNKNIVLEDQIEFSNTSWKKLVLQMFICDTEIYKTVLFTQINMTRYLIQFDCPKNKFEKTSELFNSTMLSFKYKN
jgi:hypothetical protein